MAAAVVFLWAHQRSCSGRRPAEVRHRRFSNRFGFLGSTHGFSSLRGKIRIKVGPRRRATFRRLARPSCVSLRDATRPAVCAQWRRSRSSPPSVRRPSSCRGPAGTVPSRSSFRRSARGKSRREERRRSRWRGRAGRSSAALLAHRATRSSTTSLTLSRRARRPRRPDHHGRRRGAPARVRGCRFGAASRRDPPDSYSSETRSNASPRAQLRACRPLVRTRTSRGHTGSAT